MVETYIVVDMACEVCDSEAVSLVRHGLEVVRVLAVMAVQFLQQREICPLMVRKTLSSLANCNTEPKPLETCSLRQSRR